MPSEPYENSDELRLEDLTSLPPPSASAGGKSRRMNKALRNRRLLVAFGALAAVGGAIYILARFGLDDPRFRVASVRILGGKYVTTAEIEDKFAADKDRSVLRVPLERRRREIEQISWVRSATVRRVLTGELRVTVVEREPVAFVSTPEGLSLIDEDGVILNAPRNSSFHFPVVHGVSESEAVPVRRGKMRLFEALMKDLERGGLQSGNVISEVDLQDSQDARMIVSDASGAVLLHLGRENFLARYMIYLSHIDEWRQKFPSIQSIDLRYEGQVVINADPQRDLKPPHKSTAAAEPPKPAAKPAPNVVSNSASNSATSVAIHAATNASSGAASKSTPPTVSNPQ